MKKLVYLVAVVCVLAGSVSAALVPLEEWKMDTEVLYQSSTSRYAVLSEIDPTHRLVLGESSGPLPVLTADGGGVSGLAGDKALDFTSAAAAAFCNEFKITNVDLAFDFYLKPTDKTTSQTVMYANNSWEFRISGGNLIFYVKRASDLVLSDVRTAITANQWNHVYAEVVGEDILINVDGVTVTKTGNVIGGMNDTSNRLYMGFQSTRNYTGLLDELTISEVVPEPATMVLLGLGGLLLRKKRC